MRWWVFFIYSLASLCRLILMKENIFNLWNEEKQKINTKERDDVYINKREIWFTKMGQNIGFEENGKKSFLGQ